MSGTLSERNRRFREKLIDTLPEVCTERAVIWTEVFREHEELQPITKAAIAFRETLRRMTIFIGEDDLIVGNQGSSLRATTLNPIVNTWFVDELDKFELRDGSKFRITEENKAIARELVSYWKGRNVYEQTLAVLPELTKENMDAVVFTCGYTLSKGCGHWLLGINNVLKYGFSGLEAQARQQLEQCDFADETGVDKIPFYQAVIMSCQAVKEFADRYAALAAQQAEKAQGKRREELLRIAKICSKVPYEKPESFYEAVQTVFFVQLLTQIESDGTGISLGRLDRMLQPYYDKDIADGSLTKEEAEELLDNLWLKIATIIQIWNEEDSKAFGGHPISQAITLGGYDEDGNDGTCELSYMMLDTTARVHMAQPSICCRVNKKTPEEFLMKCAETIREGLGMPAMYNDDVAVPSLIGRGIDPKDARGGFGVIGCVEMGIQGKLCGFTNSGYFNLAKAFEIMLHNGVDPQSGKQLAKPRGDVCSIGSYEEFEETFLQYMDEMVMHEVRVTNVVNTYHARVAPLPFVSALTDDCIARGIEVQSGGAEYNYDGIQGVGFADVIDGLAAVEQLVYQEKKLSMDRLMAALDHDFEGYEDVLLMLRKDVVKYGNNDERTNRIANKLASRFAQTIGSCKNPRGGFFIPGMYSNSANVPLGAVVGALPNGRRAFAPIAEACSPSHGSEKCGPTQAALSVASIDHVQFTNGTQYNQKYHPSALRGQEGLHALCGLIQAFFARGGYHIQFNVVSSEVLKQAQKNPEQYKDLVVRVAGYTAFFVDLNVDIQNDIIDRTEMDFGV